MQNNSINFIRLLITIISFITIFPISTQAQLEWNNWIVKKNIFSNLIQNEKICYNFNFSEKNTLFLTDTIEIEHDFPENSHYLKSFTTISNGKSGKLILYSNGFYVYNDQNKKINNSKLLTNNNLGFPVYNGKYNIQHNLIIPSKTNNSLYNVIYYSNKGNEGLYSAKIDVSMNSGVGECISKDYYLLDSVYGATAIYHNNLRNYWLISYSMSNNSLNAIKLDDNFEIIEKTNFNLKNINFNYSFLLDLNYIVSPKANLIAFYSDNNTNNLYYDSVTTLHIFTFDNLTGKINLKDSIKTKANKIKDIIFSKNGKYVYGFYRNPWVGYFQNSDVIKDSMTIFRYNIFNKKYEEFIIEDTTLLSGFLNNNFTNMNIGIDDCIYINYNDYNKIFRITNPEAEYQFVKIDTVYSEIDIRLLTNTFPLYPPEFELKLYTNAPLCANSDTLKLFSLFSHSEIPDVTYEWTAPNGMTYTKDSIYIPNPNMSYSGRYYLRVMSKFLDVDILDSIEVVLYPKPEYNLIMIGEPCGTAEITLKSDVEFPSKYKYLWNTGAITPELKVSKNGVYTLIVTDTNGCQTSKSIEIIFGKKPIAEIKAMGATTFCEGGRVELRATGGMSSNDLNFEWSTGEKVPNIWVDKSGIYRVVITHKFSNCRDSAEIEIKVNPNLVSKIEQIGSLCKGGEVTLQAEPKGTEYKYLWSNGEITQSIKVNQAGKYTVEVSLDGACKSSAEIEVTENQAQDFEIIAEGKFCVGEVVKLSSDKDFTEYLWSNGETTKEISVTLSGTYKLIVTDENGCTNEKSIDVEFISPREYKLDFTDYDFGNVEIGTEKRVKVNIPGELGFSLRGDFPLDINTMEMIFKPETERDYSGEIVLNYGGDCDTTATIIFKGRGVNSVKYFAKVIAPKVTTEAGLDNVELPIKFEINDENIVYPFEFDYKLRISLNFDVYIPQIPSIVNGTKREIEVVGKTQINKGENTLITIIGKTYLSQNMENPINILSFEHKTDRLTVENEDGFLNITGICVPELRGLIFFTPTKMSVSPNPVSSDLTIKINTEEKGNHKVRLVDITGNSREIGDFEVNELTEKVIKLNAKDITKGQYFLELVTPNQTIVEKVMVE